MGARQQAKPTGHKLLWQLFPQDIRPLDTLNPFLNSRHQPFRLNGNRGTSSPVLRGQRQEAQPEEVGQARVQGKGAEPPRRACGSAAPVLRAHTRPARPVWDSRSSRCRLGHWELSALMAEEPGCL